MRVGLVVEQFDPRRGGLEQWSAQFAGQLAARGHEVHVVAGRFGELTAGMPIVAHRLEKTRSRLDFAEAARRKLQTLPLDVIHDTGAGWYCDVFQPHLGSWTALGEQKMRMLPSWARPLKRAMTWALPRYREFRRLTALQYAADGRLLLALSRQVAADFQRFHSVPPDRIRLVYNGVDTARFSPEHRATYREGIRRWLGIDDQTLVLLIVAHNFRLKGVPTLLKAMGRLAAARRPVHLVVVGGKRLGRGVRAADRLGAGSAVTFAGPVDDVVPFYAAADVYVHPTFYDSFSLVVLEALASGLPVVTSRFNGAMELFTEGDEGFLLADPTNVNDLLARIEPLFDPRLRERMGRLARRLAENHTFGQNVDQVLAVYNEVVEARGNRMQPSPFPVRHPFVCRRTGAEEAREPSAAAARKVTETR
jgi:UDP-glucose:(heptosyl)LPS alpha-1,3-glucosyltransferase